MDWEDHTEVEWDAETILRPAAGPSTPAAAHLVTRPVATSRRKQAASLFAVAAARMAFAVEGVRVMFTE
jgi:hypothetical protein